LHGSDQGPGQSKSARLTLLGGFEATYAAAPLTLAQAAQRVLAMLAVVHRDRPADRTTVAEQIWPDTAPDRAVSNLRSTLWRMPRPRSRSLVVCTPRTVRLAPEVGVDLWEADDKLAQAGEPLDEHLLLDDLLPRWDDDWLDVERERFRQRRLHALESSSQALRERGRYADALTTALGAVRAEPLRETAHLRVIEVHLAEGNQSEALRQYERYSRLLHAELGLRPSRALGQLMEPLVRRPSRRRARVTG
jgi:DNA-binding SARP family transcriptional activator